MSKNILFYLIVFSVFISEDTLSQNALTRADAVKILLEKNYGIRVAKNNKRIAENNTSKKNNGYLPTLNANAGLSSNLGGSNQKFGSGMEITVTNAFNWSTNASLIANYTLIDKERDITLEQLKERVELADFETRQAIEQNLLQLYSSYYEVARLSENLKVQEQTIELSGQRLKRAQYRYDYGQGSKLDILNAEVDIQRDRINLSNVKQQLANAKRNLNFVIGQMVSEDFMVDTTVSYQSGLSLQGLLADAKAKNIEVILSDKNLQLSEYDLKIIQSGNKPVLNSSASYDFTFQDNAAQAFITSSTNRGLAVGLNLSWNLFDGGLREIRRQNTLVNIESQRIQREQTLSSLELDVTNTWESYQNALFILNAELQSLEVSQLNFERTEELFNSGQASSVDYRQAQLNLLSAATNYNTAKYDAKLIELQLLQLSGRIMEEEF